MIEPEHDAPDLEDLAAYLDGRLSADRRTQVEERLLRDEDYHDVFLESSRFLEQIGRQEAGSGGVVAPAVWWRSGKVMAPLAVAATLVVAVGLWRLMLGPSTDRWVTRLDAARIVDQEGWDDPGWPVLRSSNLALGRYQPEELAFRLGIRTVDLQVALMADRRDAARMLTALLAELADAADLVVVAYAYRVLQDQIEGAEIDALAEQASQVKALVTESYEVTPSEAGRFALGAWTEAGRLASLAGDARTLAGVFSDLHEARKIEEITPYLDDLKALLDQSYLDEQDFETAESKFRQITRALAG